jgi:hypothetical protein
MPHVRGTKRKYIDCGSTTVKVLNAQLKFETYALVGGKQVTVLVGRVLRVSVMPRRRFTSNGNQVCWTLVSA